MMFHVPLHQIIGHPPLLPPQGSDSCKSYQEHFVEGFYLCMCKAFRLPTGVNDEDGVIWVHYVDPKTWYEHCEVEKMRIKKEEANLLTEGEVSTANSQYAGAVMQFSSGKTEGQNEESVIHKKNVELQSREVQPKEVTMLSVKNIIRKGKGMDKVDGGGNQSEEEGMTSEDDPLIMGKRGTAIGSVAGSKKTPTTTSQLASVLTSTQTSLPAPAIAPGKTSSQAHAETPAKALARTPVRAPAGIRTKASAETPATAKAENHDIVDKDTQATSLLSRSRPTSMDTLPAQAPMGNAIVNQQYTREEQPVPLSQQNSLLANQYQHQPGVLMQPLPNGQPVFQRTLMGDIVVIRPEQKILWQGQWLSQREIEQRLAQSWAAQMPKLYKDTMASCYLPPDKASRRVASNPAKPATAATVPTHTVPTTAATTPTDAARTTTKAATTDADPPISVVISQMHPIYQQILRRSIAYALGTLPQNSNTNTASHCQQVNTQKTQTAVSAVGMAGISSEAHARFATTGPSRMNTVQTPTTQIGQQVSHHGRYHPYSSSPRAHKVKTNLDTTFPPFPIAGPVPDYLHKTRPDMASSLPLSSELYPHRHNLPPNASNISHSAQKENTPPASIPRSSYTNVHRQDVATQSAHTTQSMTAYTLSSASTL